MTAAPPSRASSAQPAADAALAAALLAIDPHGLGGVRLRGAPGPARDRWCAALRSLMPAGAPWRRLPAGVTDDRLLGGLDVAATLRTGRPVAERGLLAEADGGVLVVAMAERLGAGTAVHVAAALDRGAVDAQRDGLALQGAARFGVVALDEGLADDERPPERLTERLAFCLALDDRDDPARFATAAAVAAARGRLTRVAVDAAALDALCRAAAALGIGSLRAPLLAVRAARAAAALAGRRKVGPADAAAAARLVLAPRALVLPQDAPPPPPQNETAPPPPEDEGKATRDNVETIADVVIAAVRAAAPDMALGLTAAALQRARSGPDGRAGALRASARRGRRVGVRPGTTAGGARLALIATLRAAAPWQRLRRGGPVPGHPAGGGGAVAVRRDDLRIARFAERSGTTLIFAVDASGSAALHRLAETKGAVELLLAECYVRRDRVALLAFRGRAADLLLPPTGSLVRARRCLAAMPAGGGTPIATAIAAAQAVADGERRRGRTPLIVLLTDGRANVGRDGTGGRPQAEADAREAARRLRADGLAALLVDTGPRPHPFAAELAAAMGAGLVPLPGADAARLAGVVRRAAAPARAAAG